MGFLDKDVLTIVPRTTPLLRRTINIVLRPMKINPTFAEAPALRPALRVARGSIFCDCASHKFGDRLVRKREGQ
jgi:hypothetical protein